MLAHPSLAETYRRRVGEPGTLREDPELRDEAIEALCSRLVVAPCDGGGALLELHGDLARILALRVALKRENPGRDTVGILADLGVFGCGGLKPPTAFKNSIPSLLLMRIL
ncbi:hypothetical protein OIU35_32570 [Boseaceae bacterium BT-24-1]|nr:hypothetical protein [Boseaceae bacterium BT-24-1]